MHSFEDSETLSLMSKYIGTAIFFFLATSMVFSQTCPEEDCMSEPGTMAMQASGTVTAISAPTVPMITIDADTFPLGPVGIVDINETYPLANIADIQVVLNNANDSFGTYELLPSGQAFAWDEMEGLIVIPEYSDYREVSKMIIHLDRNHYEFGVKIGDWGGIVLMDLYFNGEFVGQDAFTSTITQDLYIKSSDPFNEVHIYSPFPRANWVINEFYIQEVMNIPTMGQWGKVLFGLVLLSLGMGYVVSEKWKLKSEK